ncbi:MAG TPA: K(+)-transporting ATPase subunit C [Chitinophagaceae bacterium]|nr:K(+)-transporting ATPase subunit C [Chitinophagaceae bacterium]
MKNNFFISLRLTLVLLLLCAVLFPLLMAAIGTLAPGRGRGETLTYKGRVVGYARVGQRFTQDRYFWGRPSAVDYNAAGSSGSNKGPSNPDYLKQVQDRIDSFLVHNPGVRKQEIPSDLVTASASGLDPDISPASAYVQVARVARARGLDPAKISALVDRHVEGPWLGLLGPRKVNVLKLNIDLDELK